MAGRQPVRVEPLTVGELVHGGPLAGAPLVTGVGLDRPVRQVRLVESLAEVRSGRPDTAVVLHRDVAGSGWTVESALLTAWEAAAACVVAPTGSLRTRSVEALARRLELALIGAEGDMAEHALALAAAVARPAAARAGIVARCALRLAEAGTSPRSLVGTLNRELPGVQVALVAGDGTVVAGQAAAAGGAREKSRVVRVDMSGPDDFALATLVASVSQSSPAWAETVRSILRIAAAPLAGALVRLRSRLEHQGAHARLVFAELLGGGDGAAEAALALGWEIRGRHIAALVVPATPRPDAELDRLTPGVLGGWRATGTRRPLVRHGDGWATWWTAAEDDDRVRAPARVVADLRRLVRSAHPGVPLVGGVGEPGDAVPGLARSLGQAAAAAAAAREGDVGAGTTRAGGPPVVAFGRLGPRSVLAGLAHADLSGAARTALAAVLAVDDGMTLVETMVAVLDAGGSSSRAAARLGVHRNTVLARLERLRRLGVDLADPQARLALHLAGYALTRPHSPS